MKQSWAVLELKTSKLATVAVQLGAAWVVGAVAPPMLWRALLITIFTGAMGLSIVIVLVGAVLACLIVVITATHEVSILGATGGLRVLWALFVLGWGSAGWALGWATTDVAGLGISHNPQLTFVLGGVPFVLAAGLLLRGWQFGTAALGLSVLLIGASVVVLRHESPDELDARLAANSVYRQTAYAVAIPGYLPTDQPNYGNGRGGGSFHPTNPDAVPPDRYITITAHDRVIPGAQMCGQPTADDSHLTWGTCTVEPNGLVYRHNEIEHGYQVPVDHLYVTVVATPAVDHDMVRAAALSLHQATVDELGGHPAQAGEYYAATVPGYIRQVTGIPPGMLYAPADHTGNGAQSVFISLSVGYAASDSICFRTIECTPDGAGLTYIRTDDAHGYVIRREQVDVRVVGGLRVDKTLLRQAALDARPATDAELRRALPPLKPRNPVDRLRLWLRKF